MLDKLLGIANRISLILVWLGGAALIFAAALTTLDVLLRKFVNFSFGGADEISGYIFAIATSFAFSYAMLQRTHVRIDALYIKLPRPVKIFLDVTGFLILGAFVILVGARAYFVWYGSYVNDSVSITPLVTPLAIPQGFWVLGFGFFVLCFIILLLRVVEALVQRDWTTISQLISARSLEEEITEDAEHAAHEIEREHALHQETANN